MHTHGPTVLQIVSGVPQATPIPGALPQIGNPISACGGGRGLAGGREQASAEWGRRQEETVVMGTGEQPNLAQKRLSAFGEIPPPPSLCELSPRLPASLYPRVLPLSAPQRVRLPPRPLCAPARPHPPLPSQAPTSPQPPNPQPERPWNHPDLPVPRPLKTSRGSGSDGYRWTFSPTHLASHSSPARPTSSEGFLPPVKHRVTLNNSGRDC